MVINIINLPRRTERRESVIAQMESEGCSYTFWDGIEGSTPKVNIQRAHKQIVLHAKNNHQNEVAIAEDDLCWTSPGAWKYFLSNKPDDYDIYLSSYYAGKADADNTIKPFSGLTLYILHSRYFDKFLSAPETYHLDTALSVMGGRFVVCDKFVAIQKDGYSDNIKREISYTHRLVGKPIFGR